MTLYITLTRKPAWKSLQTAIFYELYLLVLQGYKHHDESAVNKWSQATGNLVQIPKEQQNRLCSMLEASKL